MTTFSASSASDPPQAAVGLGSKDGLGGGDNDQAYTFGRRPRAVAPFPFNHRQYARLLALRGSIADGLRGGDDTHTVDAGTCPRLTPDSDRDEVARAILDTAGVLSADWESSRNVRA